MPKPFAPSPGSQLAILGRFAWRLRGFVRHPSDAATCRERTAAGLRSRAANLLHAIEAGVFAQPESPYRHLFRHAGIELGDVRHAVETTGVEASLATLADAGVFLRLDEFKGRRPIERGSLRLEAAPHDFDNPLANRHFSSQTGGSRSGSGGTRIYIDLDSYAQDAAYQHHLLDAFGLLGRPAAAWCPLPPFSSGINEVLRSVKLGRPPDRWFAQSRPSYRGRTWRHAVLADCLIHAGRLHGAAIPIPEPVPLGDAHLVAQWLAAQRAAGAPAVLKTNVASGIRVCLAARERDLDIAGSFFRVDSEPLTPARAAVFARAGCAVANTYAMTEAGWVGVPCARPEFPDEVHLVSDKIALLQRPVRSAQGLAACANFYTTLLPSTPKLMLNVDCGDYSAATSRSCGCLLERLGYTTHLHTVRSYDKLTGEGMNFLGDDLHRLIEEVLPARFGGSPMDYQLVETELDGAGLPQVQVIVSPAVGKVEDAEVVAAVIAFLDQVPGAGGFGRRWEEAGTLRVWRREPFATGATKVLPLHIAKQLGAETRERSDTPV